jgi:NADH-quinone oxidoreductase subunit G
MENDLYRRDSASLIDSLLEKVTNIIVLDSHENATLSASSLALPAASFAESEGTLISLEGRAQRYFPVFESNSEQKASWVWLLACLKELANPIAADINHFDDITNACAAEIPALAAITTAAPDHLYRNAGLKIPRQTHRYSGRTAMHADISVHEPKQPVDNESALAFTMEGLNSSQPGSLLPYVWAPGWNSNQSLHKFQSEVGGALIGGTAGTRLLTNNPSPNSSQNKSTPNAFKALASYWQLIPRHKIFGSDELSTLSPAIAELIERAFIEINNVDAEQLNVADGDGLEVGGGNGEALATLQVHINDSIPNGCAAYSVGFEGTFNLKTGDSVTLAKAAQWQRQQKAPAQKDLIASDGGQHV